MSSSVTPPIVEQPDLADAYQDLFDILGTAYWHATDIDSKDLLHGTQAAIGDILTALDEDQLARNTCAFTAILPKVKAVNDALKQVQETITTITKDIDTAAQVLAAANKLLTLVPL
jgi:hypothetical protein